ncbi:histidine kinase [Flavobacterium limnosediminis JC2902]|uniref:histidine kinase n=1 Tax=Flavobacterium limnosediminis JC2902 TaxID=1341181 RepID=V6SRF6_9FLAO|nr:HAMP domain-containing sensor histidine kinase [Flavobacterium limnosediminis]ESU27010.1 histidine kinase [Flavobacterium limnosediminis JC2902]
MAKNYLIITAIFFILAIISILVIYYSAKLKKLMLSKQETEVQNNNLLNINKELDKFVYSISHDLRSPIISVKGLVEIAQKEDNISQIKEYLNLMHQSLTQQDQFIRDIIDYSRNKRNQVCIESVSLNKLIDEAISQHQHIKEENPITITKNILADEIITDSLRLRIILNNLISNAVKYSDANKPFKHIAIKTHEKDSCYVMEIEDNGVGIKKDHLQKIFDMFFVTDNNMGSGLGLYIVKEAAEYLNGNIAVNSEKNIGTTFTVTLPKPKDFDFSKISTET